MWPGEGEQGFPGRGQQFPWCLPDGGSGGKSDVMELAGCSIRGMTGLHPATRMMRILPPRRGHHPSSLALSHVEGPSRREPEGAEGRSGSHPSLLHPHPAWLHWSSCRIWLWSRGLYLGSRRSWPTFCMGRGTRGSRPLRTTVRARGWAAAREDDLTVGWVGVASNHPTRRTDSIAS